MSTSDPSQSPLDPPVVQESTKAPRKPRRSDEERVTAEDQTMRDLAEEHSRKAHAEIFEHEAPASGGSFIREPDGTLTSQEG